MESFTCQKGCCLLKTTIYKHDKKIFRRNANRKAGVFIYDPNKRKVLLVQSRGNLWGPPKGTLKYGETERRCAIREVKEETGLTVTMNEFSRATIIRNRAIYFYVERDECEVFVQEQIPYNDVNALGWVKIECLEQCIIDGYITLTQHCRIVFQRFMGCRFSHSTFILVERKKRRKKILLEEEEKKKNNTN